MIKRVFSPFFLLLIVFLFTSCGPPLYWRANRPLTWDDFKSNEYGNTHDASTHWLIRYNYHLRGRSNGNYLFNFYVYAAISPGQSWVSPLHKGSVSLLKHEQLHFDIAELYTRKLYIAFNEKTYSANYKSEIREVFEEWFKALKDAQAAYDEQSEHSLNKEAQGRWEKVIGDELKKTPAYPLTSQK